MAYYAFLDENNVVTEVIAGRNEYEIVGGISDWETYYGNLRNQVCKRTSYNNNIRRYFAGIGFSYDEVRDEFVFPQPYPSWTLDSNNDWQAPTPKPEGDFNWDEESLSWLAIPVG